MLVIDFMKVSCKNSKIDYTAKLLLNVLKE